MSKKHFRAPAEAIASIADKAERAALRVWLPMFASGFNGRF